MLEKKINRLISKVSYGYKWNGKVVHSNSQQEQISYYKGDVKYLSSITYDKYASHFAGTDTFYFTGGNGDFTLCMIDIDCHNKGTPEGAVKAAEYIKTNIFPNAFFEPSTNKKGQHGYIIIDKRGMTIKDTNDWEKKLQTYLDGLNLPNIEMIEVMGHIPYPIYDAKNKVINCNCGTLAKLPREAHLREHDFSIITVVKPHTFMFPVNNTSTEVKNIVKPLPKKKGSCSGHFINPWLKLIPLAKQLMEVKKAIKINSEVKINQEDMAILLSIIFFCSKNMNADGTLPTARIKGFWNALVDSGETTRQFNSQRLKAMRTLLAEKGLLQIEDEGYIPADGKGIAMKWGLNEKTITYIEYVFTKKEEERTSFVLGHLAGHSQSFVPFIKVIPFPTIEDIERVMLRKAA